MNPPKTNQPSAAKKIVDFDRTKDKEEEKEEVFGLRTDIYGDKKGIKVNLRNIFKSWNGHIRLLEKY